MAVYRIFQIRTVTKYSLVFLFALVGTDVYAQSDYQFHPMLEDKFNIKLGAFRSEATLKASAELTAEDFSEDIDFEKTLGVDDKATVFSGDFRWRFGEKWSVSGQYFGVNLSDENVIEQDVEWQGVIFKAGSFVGSGFSTRVGRLFFGRTFSTSAQHEFGAGLGIHYLRFKTYIEGDIDTSLGGKEFVRQDADTSQPLPNLGVWWMYSPARRWLIDTRLDFFSASIDKYDGTLINGSIAVNYQAFRHVGFALAYQYFNVNLNVDKSDWTGELDARYSGPMLSATFTW